MVVVKRKAKKGNGDVPFPYLSAVTLRGVGIMELGKDLAADHAHSIALRMHATDVSGPI